MNSSTRKQTSRLAAAIALFVAGALSFACSAADPGAPTGQRIGPPIGGGLADASNNPGPMVTPDAGGGDLPDSAPAADAGSTSDATADTSDAPLGEVLSLTLVDTSITNQIAGSPVAGYDPLKNNSTFSLGTVGTQLSIRANINPTATVASVLFAYDAVNHTENATPWTLCGDDGAGTITNCNLTAGTHTLTVTTYTQAAMAGTAGTPYTITFTITP